MEEFENKKVGERDELEGGGDTGSVKGTWPVVADFENGGRRATSEGLSKGGI